MVPQEKKVHAIGAFNVQNLESVKAIVEAATEEKSPAILQITPSVIKYAALGYITSSWSKTLAKNYWPLTMHLDHGEDYETLSNVLTLALPQL